MLHPDLEIVPLERGSDQGTSDTDRLGFIVVGPQPDCKLVAYEGFSLGSPDGKRLVEYDVVEFAKIDTPRNLKGTGVGRMLMRAAVEETRQRGYDRLRLTTHNARVVSNLAKLAREGVVEDVKHF